MMKWVAGTLDDKYQLGTNKDDHHHHHYHNDDDHDDDEGEGCKALAWMVSTN